MKVHIILTPVRLMQLRVRPVRLLSCPAEVLSPALVGHADMSAMCQVATMRSSAPCSR